MACCPDDEGLVSEWLEADGLGGYASGTVSGIRSRRYHALLLTATTPPTGRIVLVNGIEAWLETPGGRFALTAQRYVPDVVFPDGWSRLIDFDHRRWPRWTFRAEDGTTVTHELAASHGSPEVALRWRAPPNAPQRPNVRLIVRPLLSGRDYHALHRENDVFDFEPDVAGPCITWRTYPGLPAISIVTNGSYRHDPVWYRNFLYATERERGLDAVEDLASPGSFLFDLAAGDAIVILRAGAADPNAVADPAGCGHGLFRREAARRAAIASPSAHAASAYLHAASAYLHAASAYLHAASAYVHAASAYVHAASAYLVARGGGRTIIAGYPWFTDWGRDTFIALRGFMTVPGGVDLARDVLLAWTAHVSEGMLPNRFPDNASDAAGQPEYGAVDAALWYVVAVHDYLLAARRASKAEPPAAEPLHQAVERILAAYRAGTRFGIHMAPDGLLAAGVAGRQLTWMDARVDGRPVTPRIGKPVEVEALWLNALAVGRALSGEWDEPFTRALRSFRARFWNPQRNCLFDVVDVDHRAGDDDASIRPNQILAIGGLPLQILDGSRARRTVRTVEETLLTPLGLRSLAPGEPGYCAHYRGGPRERDAAYHQGTVWPWLIGPFIEAWLRVRGDTPAARREAAARFLAPLDEHLEAAGLGHISEVADAEPPYRPGGCPFQAWSLGEYLRARALVGDGACGAETPPSGAL